MKDLINEFSELEFIFLNAPGSLWLDDGKDGSEINESTKAKDSCTLIDNYIENNGGINEFKGILGYSQGGCMVNIYNYFGTYQNEFDFNIIFNGYPPLYNTDLIAKSVGVSIQGNSANI